MKHYLKITALILLLILTFVISQMASAETKTGYTIEKYTALPANYQPTSYLTDRNDRQFLILSSDSDAFEKCGLTYNQNLESPSVSLDSWVHTKEGRRYCDEFAQAVFLPNGNIFEFHVENAVDFVVRQITSSGVNISENRVTIGADYDSLNFTKVVSSAGGTIAFALDNGKNTLLFIFQNGSLKSYFYPGRYFVSNIKDWGEVLMKNRLGNKSFIARISDGKVVKKIKFGANDFNRHHEIVGNTEFQLRTGKYELPDCSFPNSIRMKDIQYGAIDNQGTVYGIAHASESADSDAYFKVKLKRSKNGYTGKDNFCTKTKIQLENACGRRLLFSNDLNGFIPFAPFEEDPLICTARVTVVDSLGKPLKGLNAVILEHAHPGVAAVIQKTNLQGQALLNFVLHPPYGEVTIVAPFLDKKYRPFGETTVSSYYDPGE
jgi:hypothetical protein